MKRSYLIAVVGLVIIGCKTEKPDLTHIREAITAEETKNILFTLASDEMKGRDSESGGYANAAAFVSTYFQQHNIQPFYPAYRDSLLTDSLWSYNIVGSIGKYDPAKKTVLIGAHLDHIGIKEREGDRIFNGANDNASGAHSCIANCPFFSTKRMETECSGCSVCR